MEQTEMFKPEDTRLSYSSANLLRNCEQKYHHYKVTKKDVDSDAGARDNSHFAIGTSFHYVNEISMHTKPAKVIELLEKCVQDEGLNEDDVGLVHAMLIQYWRLRSKGEFHAVACEYKIDDKSVVGYVDLIEQTKDGYWTISDLKTAASFYESKIPELPRDRQLNLYGSYAKEIAKAHNLDIDKFLGCRYLVTTKSKAKQQKKESYKEYVMRMVDKKLVRSYAIFIPKELMDYSGAKEEHMKLYKRSIQLRKGTAEPKKNYTYCNSFFRPCEYFSQCHGMTATEYMENKQIIVEAIK